MCDISEENLEINKGKIEKGPTIEQDVPVFDLNFINHDMNEGNSLKSESPSSFISPPSPTFFLQNFSFKSFPSLDYTTNKLKQIKSKSLRFQKVTNDLRNKISLLEEIYDGPEYKRPKMCNKLVECILDEEAPHKLVARLISRLNIDNSSLCDRTVHPAYSTEEQEDEQTMDSSGLFKIPSTPYMSSDTCLQDTNDMYEAAYFEADQREQQPIETDSLFIEHEGNTYIRVDDTNYHLVVSLTEDGVVLTETGLQIILPDGTEIPQTDTYTNHQISDQTIEHSQQNMDPFFRENQTHPRKNQRNDVSPFFGHLSYHTGNTAKPYSDYVALPLRPAPLMPFTLSSQLYTPELSISLTEQEGELMLTIDSAKRALPQQQAVYYQIYSYKDEDRHMKPTSEVWGLVGEIKSCTLPMFCTISIPSGYYKHYFAIRSVDEFSRFSDWSNVVQVEVEESQSRRVSR